MKYLFLLCFLFSCKPSVYIQWKDTINCEIETIDGKPLNGVYVSSKKPKVDLFCGVAYFEIAGVKNNITLRFQCPGYKEQSIYCSPGARLHIRMAVDSVLDPQLIRNYYNTRTTINDRNRHE